MSPGSPADLAPGVPGTPGIAPIGVPRSAADLRALRRHRSEVSDQLTSVQRRRDQLAQQLRDPMVGGADRTGIEQRLRVVDGRILALENDLSATGQLVATVAVTGASGPDMPPRGAGFPAGFATGTGLTLAGALLVGRLVGRRRRPTAARDPGVDSARLARVEQSIEAVAIEVERISEGQRFVTQVVAGRQQEHARAYTPTLDAE